MRVLIVGGGGREHALAWKVAQRPGVDVWATPGNAGIGECATLERVPADNVGAVAELATRLKPDLTIVGPEAPLCAGLVNALEAQGLRAFGPTREAALLEGSKVFAKEFMARHNIPTAPFAVFDSASDAERSVETHAGPVVVKADGLCAGKGVVVCDDRAQAKAAIRRMLVEREFGEAGSRVVIEERLRGRELSVMALTDGERVVLLPTAEDHKAVYDGDKGPNTGGMGACSPSTVCTPAVIEHVLERVLLPTVQGMAREGRRFCGVLYAGLMLTEERGPMVLEYNCRFGDPETQVVLMRWAEDVLPWLLGAAEGRLPGDALKVDERAAVCVVLAAEGYPGKVVKGDPIAGLQQAVGVPDVVIFHAGTARGQDGRIVTAGGRVLGVSALGNNVREARAKAYEAIGRIHFRGMHYRKDIGARGGA